MAARTYRAYLVDVEGVLVRDKAYAPVAGSPEWFAGLAARGLRRVLVSNNTTHTPAEQAAALAAAGYGVTADDVVGVLDVAVSLLRGWGKTRLLWLGHPRLRPWWESAGFSLADGGPCDAVVLGANPHLDLADLDRALPALLDQGAELVALHRNLFWLDEAGRRRLGPGCHVESLAPLARRDPVIVGKPRERIYREALKRLGVDAADALFISDDPVADLVTAKRLGMGTAFVLSGKHPDHAVLERLDQEDWPDVIADRPCDLDPVAPAEPPEE
ncbi:MAG TPA: HAD hydrolase-like protein [Candidatus Krumholzibacteria bacterium]|nr:HAD hydrolase-like protein [Candidatus Krumholzibacteria bacterium]HRX49812.1 HAD hydrolase-like protein [Candidatus Krumholzibacteria bacterium]